MKKIFVVMSVAILIALLSAPSLVFAGVQNPDWGSSIPQVGYAYTSYFGDSTPHLYIVRCTISEPTWVYADGVGRQLYTAPVKGSTSDNVPFIFYYAERSSAHISLNKLVALYIPTLDGNYSIDGTTKIFNNISDFNELVPESDRLPDPSLASERWDAFYEWYKNKYGFYPLPGSFIDLLRKMALGDDSEDTEITFLTLTPAPSPTPTPTPISVQTIFVPDGNGNTTIIYQYPDPTTGVITQSPYNPNVTNNITVNCDCDVGSGGGSGTFTSSPQDPYSYDASLFWADGFGVQMSESPLAAASDSQTTLKAAAMEYDSSVEVLSNSFNILPFKWLVLVGCAGGILIIAGLIRTFLGG